jgi:hypothetical protein
MTGSCGVRESSDHLSVCLFVHPRKCVHSLESPSLCRHTFSRVCLFLIPMKILKLNPVWVMVMCTCYLDWTFLMFKNLHAELLAENFFLKGKNIYMYTKRFWLPDIKFIRYQLISMLQIRISILFSDAQAKFGNPKSYDCKNVNSLFLRS